MEARERMVTSPARVLVVDDEKEFAENLARLLRHRGFDAEAAHDGLAALDACKSRPFNVVLLDVNMPGMDGIEVLRELKVFSPETEIIMLTGQATVETGIAAIHAGAFDYLIKPCEIEELTEKLKSLADLIQIRRHPVLWPRSKVGEVAMYSFKKLTTSDPLSKALELFNSDRRKMAGEIFFIVNEEGALCGTITQQALIDAACEAHPGANFTWEDLRKQPEWLPALTIGEKMAPQAAATEFDTPLMAVARLMIEERMRSMPVVENGRVVGIVRLRDVLKYLEPETNQGDQFS